MYNLWPESVPFRDCADLNFPQYLEKIKDPIALDVIKERLDEENPDQVCILTDLPSISCLLLSVLQCKRVLSRP